MRKIYILLIVCVALSAFAVQAFGAAWSERYSRASVFFAHNSWQEDFGAADASLNQSVSGFSLQHVAGEQFEFGVWSSLSSNTLTDFKDDETSLSTFNDIRLTGDYFLADRSVVVGVSVNLPTGKKELNAEEYAVLLGLADNSRSYVVRRLGQGLNLGGEVFWMPLVGEAHLTLGGGYLYRGAYRVLAVDDADYQYGSEFYGRLGLSRAPQSVGFGIALEVRAFGKDNYDGLEVFQAGNTVAVTGHLRFIGEWRGSIGVGLLIRSKSKIAATGTASLTEEAAKSGRDEMRFYATIGRMLSEKLQLLGRGEFKSVSENDYDEAAGAYRPKASYVGFGGGFGYQFGLNVSGSLLGTYYVGSVAEDNDLTGLGITVALTFRYW